MKELSTTPAEKLPFFFVQNCSLGAIKPEDDLLHPASFSNLTDVAATETQYFGFSIPEENIHAVNYLWWHPNLKLVTGGLYVFQGVKETWVHAEICDWRNFMSDKVLANDLHEYRLDNGYGVKILELNKKFHITYSDPAQQNSVDVIATGCLPGVMFADGKHFEQTMKTTGTITLRGKQYDVNSHSIRDRSWGKPRPETLMPVPPLSWMCATFSNDFSFNCAVFDHESGQPERKGQMVMSDDRALNSGWVYRGGKLGRIVRAKKHISRGAGSTVCSGIELEFSDEHGREFKAKAQLLSSCPMPLWPNAWVVINLMHWECDGLTGHGDNQEAFYGNYLNSRLYKALR